MDGGDRPFSLTILSEYPTLLIELSCPSAVCGLDLNLSVYHARRPEERNLLQNRDEETLRASRQARSPEDRTLQKKLAH